VGGRSGLGCSGGLQLILASRIKVGENPVRRALAAEAKVPVSNLPGLVGRDDSSPAEVVDEYLWVPCAHGCTPPSPKVFGDWATWSPK